MWPHLSVRGDAISARAPLAEAVRLFTEQADHRRLIHVLSLLGLTMAALGDGHAAVDLHEQAIAVARASDNPWMEAYNLTNGGAALALIGDAPAAREKYRRSLEAFVRLDDAWGQAIALRAHTLFGGQSGVTKRSRWRCTRRACRGFGKWATHADSRKRCWHSARWSWRMRPRPG